MTAETISGPQPKSDPGRMLQARLDMIVTALPIGAWFNPGWALVSIVPFLGFFPMFGRESAWSLVAFMAVHLFNSVVAMDLYRRYRSNPTNTTGVVLAADRLSGAERRKLGIAAVAAVGRRQRRQQCGDPGSHRGGAVVLRGRARHAPWHLSGGRERDCRADAGAFPERHGRSGFSDRGDFSA